LGVYLFFFSTETVPPPFQFWLGLLVDPRGCLRIVLSPSSRGSSGGESSTGPTPVRGPCSGCWGPRGSLVRGPFSPGWDNAALREPVPYHPSGWLRFVWGVLSLIFARAVVVGGRRLAVWLYQEPARRIGRLGVMGGFVFLCYVMESGTLAIFSPSHFFFCGYWPLRRLAWSRPPPEVAPFVQVSSFQCGGRRFHRFFGRVFCFFPQDNTTFHLTRGDSIDDF